MQIWQCRQHCLRPLQGPTALLGALFGKEKSAPLAAFVGAGGKSTLIDALGVQAARRGWHALISTTTHIWRPDGGVVTVQDSPAKLAAVCRTHAVVTAGQPDGNGKLAMLPALSWKRMRGQVDIILLEADGAKGRPIKAPRTHEPVLPPQVTHVCAVVGLHALGQTLEQAGFGVQALGRVLAKTPQETVEAMDIVRLCASKAGGRKHVPAHARYCVCLHQADTPRRLAQAARIADALEERGICCLITAGREENGHAGID